ncbi:MAG: dihydropteroate synthase [Phycisphaerales bacterium]|nr:dihydropteroate synthase [Phycisphaerales bacterium]
MKIVGIVNITRDSFSDGGRFLAPHDAIAHAERLIADGADIVELGARSTHPDSELVSADEEIARLAPVLTTLTARGLKISIDTAQPDVMQFAVEHGAAMMNDVTGFCDPRSIEAVGASSALLVVMHAVRSRTAEPDPARAERIATTPAAAVDGAMRFLRDRASALIAAGVDSTRLVLDPGMGFFLSSRADASLAMLRSLGQIRAIGHPLMISVSRKSFIGALLGAHGAPRPIADRGAATLATELWAYTQGVQYLRTHDVRALRDAVTLWRAIAGERPETGEST